MDIELAILFKLEPLGEVILVRCAGRLGLRRSCQSLAHGAASGCLRTSRTKGPARGPRELAIASQIPKASVGRLFLAER